MRRWLSGVSRLLLRWLEHVGIHVGALLALCLIAATSTMSYFKSPWLLEPNNRPLVYDLSIGYLAAWFFNLLVITIPTLNRQRVVWDTLRAQLWRIANNPVDVVHDLAFLARCPEETPTAEYIRKVCTAVNSNDDSTQFLNSRLSEIHDDWEQVVPYLRDLPADVAATIHRIVRYGALGSATTFDAIDLDKLRRPSPLYSFTDGKWAAERHTFRMYENRLFDYFREGEILRAVLQKVYRHDPRTPWHTSPLLLAVINDRRAPYTSFPEETENTSWPADVELPSMWQSGPGSD